MPGPRTPLLRPDRYFSAHDGSPPLGLAATAVVAVRAGVVRADGLAHVRDVSPGDAAAKWACSRSSASASS